MNKEKHLGAKIFVCTAFVLYVLIMILLLFLQRFWSAVYQFNAIQNGCFTYLELVKGSLNFVPFKSIVQILGMFSYRPQYVIRNIGGNIILFMPLGYFFPYFWKSKRKFWRLFLTVCITIICIEAIQVFTLLGKCDIDDLILNVLGGVLGYFMCKIPVILRFLVRFHLEKFN